MTRSVNNIQYVLNVPLLIATALVGALAIVGGYFWHGWQVNQLAASLKERSKQLAEEKKYDDAIGDLLQYVQIRPQDVEGRIELAQLLDRIAVDLRGKTQAIAQFRRAVLLAPERHEVRLRLAELLLETAKFGDAKVQASEVLRAQQKDSKASQILALASFFESLNSAKADWSSIRDQLVRALQENPADLKLAACAAEIYRNKKLTLELQNTGQGGSNSDLLRDKLADQIIDQLVEANNQSAAALLARYRYRQRFGLAGSNDDLDEAIRKAPDDPAVLLAAGERAAQNQQRDEAEKLFSKLVVASPKDRRGYIYLAQLQSERKDRSAAIKSLRAGISAVGGTDLLLGWRLADLLIDERDFAAADAVLKDLEASIQKSQAILPQALRDSMQAETDVIHARWWAAQGRLLRAAAILDRLLNLKFTPLDGERYVTAPIQVMRMLGEILMRSGQWDRATVAYENLLAANPDLADARANAAKSSLMAGQVDAAIRHLEMVIKPAALQGRASSELNLLYAQALFQHEIRHPEAERNWDKFNAVLAQEAKAQEAQKRELKTADASAEIAETAEARSKSSHWPWLVLKAEYEMASGSREQAIADLNKAEQENPADDACLRAIATGYERLGQTVDADRVLDAWQKLNPARPDALLAKATVLVRRGMVDEARALLAPVKDSLPEPGRSEVLRQLARIQAHQGNLVAARDAMAELSTAHPDNLEWLKELVELAFQTADFATIEKCEQQLKNEFEGEDGAWWRFYRARRLLEVAKGEKNENGALLAEAQQLAQSLETARPTWPESHLLRGKVAEQIGKPQDAIAAYRLVLELDDQRTAVRERLIELLLSNQQIAEAEKALAQMRESEKSARLSQYEIALSTQQGNTDRAVDLAESMVRRDPNSPLSHILLAQSRLLQKENDKAEEELRKAVELGPADYRAWGALLLFYVHTQRPQQARHALEQIEKKVDLPADAKAALLGQGYELIGDVAAAEKYYKTATSLNPDSLKLKQRLTSLLVRTDSSEADAALETLERLASRGEDRRRVAALLSSQRDNPQSIERALAELSYPEKDAAEAAQNHRLKVKILLDRNAPGDRDQAIEILSSLTEQPAFAAPQDHLFLAGLMEAKGNQSVARQQFEAAATSPRAEPMHWGLFADFLLRHHFPNEAATWIRRLEEQEPGRFATIALRARLTHRQGKSEQIEQLVKPVIDALLAAAEEKKDVAQKANINLATGQLYLQVEQPKAALPYLQNAYEGVATAYVPLVSTLVQLKQIQEAMDICRKVAEDRANAQPAVILATALLTTGATPTDMEIGEPIFSTALQKYGDNIELLMALASIRFMQGRYSDVISLSQQVLDRDPNHVLAMNNLASLLAESDDRASRARSIEIIERALKIEGRLPTLLDTKGMALFHQGQTDEAVKYLKEAVAGSPSEPRFLFHLAVAYHRLGDREQAKSNLQLAREKKLPLNQLTPTEKRLLEELIDQNARNLQTSNPRTSGGAR
ncbi:MAG: tetratricopeptide repeat protein [Pirellulales bacterium]|nr:tetratricopeptide repeat protein [Pirellulales bacterium]